MHARSRWCGRSWGLGWASSIRFWWTTRRSQRNSGIWRPFNRYRRLAGLNKPVRPHLLRHTAATQLLFNGCPVGHIKEILGHERLETTCRYYLGLDTRAAKLAHQRYLVYDASYGTTEEKRLAC